MSEQQVAVILDQATFGPDQPDWRPLLNLPYDWRCYGQTSSTETEQRIADATVVMTNKVVLDAARIKQARNLKYIGVLATGVNNIDVEAATGRGIQVQNVEGYGTPSVVQHTLMLMLNLAGNVQRYQQNIRQGDWPRASMFCLLNHKMFELQGKLLLIVGYGELGRSVANIAKAFGMRVSIAARPGENAGWDGEIHRCDLDAVLPDADFVSLHCLLSDSTRHIINARRLSLMKPEACLINTARGPLIDEEALASALRNKSIGGAGLDVLSQEPPDVDNPLLGLRDTNLIITPHNAWATVEARQRLIDIAATHLQQFSSR